MQIILGKVRHTHAAPAEGHPQVLIIPRLGIDGGSAFDRWLSAEIRKAKAEGQEALKEALKEAYPIIRDMVDPDPCWFDHHGGCQAHGYISLEPGETCPHHDAKQWLERMEGADDECA